LDLYLGIGGNLGNRLENIGKVIELISDRIAVPEKVSPIYLSEPWGFNHAKYFTNAMLKIDTDLTPTKLLQIILDIESELKRVRSQSGYEGRTMDIDIIYYGDKKINCDNLVVPHPKSKDRLFVLLPLKDIDPNFVDPITGKTIDNMLSECSDKCRIRKIKI
jgi:2-amino-4-hydroxy-6-hydroxymethyldihydropteridine diphosphokinase